MQPESPLSVLSRVALRLWCGLRDAYDQIEGALEAPDQHDLALLGARIVALECELEPIIAELAAERSRRAAAEPALAPLLEEIDQVVASLATRQPELVRAALAARAATAVRLEGVRVARGRLRDYGSSDAGAPRLTSQRV
jgi:hypothetical protein